MQTFIPIWIYMQITKLRLQQKTLCKNEARRREYKKVKPNKNILQQFNYQAQFKPIIWLTQQNTTDYYFNTLEKPTSLKLSI